VIECRWARDRQAQRDLRPAWLVRARSEDQRRETDSNQRLAPTADQVLMTILSRARLGYNVGGVEPLFLGKYELLKRIAAGGMAEIFVARVRGIPGFEKIVCIKRILPQLAGNREFVDMFLDEARIAATLHHANIVQMYDVGEADGSYFISMEFLHGVDVRTLIKGMRERQQWIPLEHALHIVIGMCAGLHYAHDKVGFDGRPLGIVHRDVNPHNVFVTYDGAVKIVDFGIAKATNRFNETRAGTLKGKIPYMSPEQCKGEAIDRRSDIFAIGIMLYELTTAYRLYKGQSEFEVLKKIVEGTITPPTALRPDYPPSLEAITLKALAKPREQRYQSARELQVDLEGFAREHRMAISAISLSSYVQELRPKAALAWQEAKAGGVDVVTRLIDATAPSKPGEPQKINEDDDPGDEGPLDTVTIADTPLPRIDRSGSGLGPTPTANGERAHAESASVVLARKSRTPLLLIAGALTAVAAVLVVVLMKGRGGGVAHAPELPFADAAVIAIVEPPDAAPADATVVVIADVTPDAGVKKPPRDKPRPPKDKPPVNLPPGELRLSSNPSCEVLVDGKARGATPLGGIMLSPGKHKVQLVNSRFKIDQTYTVEIKSGEVTKKKFDLMKP
jgi:serine/threonine protein kinase